MAPSTIALLVVALVILIIVILFMSYYRTITNIASFAYINAKLHVLAPAYITMEKINQLVETGGISEATSMLAASGMEVRGSRWEDIETSLDAEYVRIVDYVLSSVPEGIRVFTEAYKGYVEMQILKRALALKNVGEEEAIEKLPIIGGVDKSLLRDIAEAHDLDGALAVIREKYGFEECSDIVGCMLEMDKCALGNMRRSLAGIDSSLGASIREFVGVLIDSINIKIALRGIKLGIADIKKHMMGGGWHLADWMLEQLCDSRDVGDIARALEGTPYASIKEARDVEDAERLLDKIILLKAREISGKDPLLTGQLVYFLAAKEVEIRNIRAVLLALYHGKSIREFADSLVVIS